MVVIYMSKLKLFINFILFIALSYTYYLVIDYCAIHFFETIQTENYFTIVAFIIYLVIIVPLILILIKNNK